MRSTPHRPHSAAATARRAPRPPISPARRLLPYAILVSVSAWAGLERSSTGLALAWNDTLVVRVVPLVAPGVAGTDGFGLAAGFLSTSGEGSAGLRGVRDWFEAQYANFTGDRAAVLQFDPRPIRSVLSDAPSLGTGSPGPLARRLEQRRLLSYCRAAGELDAVDAAPRADVTLYVYFYAPEDRGHYSGRSMACRGGREGVVFIPIDPATLGYYEALLAHELCHTLGATDKYDASGCRYPHGYADPERTPLFPQTHAEIMAMGIPRSPGTEAYIGGVEDCVVGRSTALEMGWTPPANAR